MINKDSVTVSVQHIRKEIIKCNFLMFKLMPVSLLGLLRFIVLIKSFVFSG